MDLCYDALIFPGRQCSKDACRFPHKVLYNILLSEGLHGGFVLSSVDSVWFIHILWLNVAPVDFESRCHGRYLSYSVLPNISLREPNKAS